MKLEITSSDQKTSFRAMKRSRKDPVYRPDRFEYLQALMTEYCQTDKVGDKHEIVANLANFAYNPVNHGHFQKLNLLDLFLDLTDDEDLELRR